MADPSELLTPRQQEVLALLRLGLTDGEIAERLGISVRGAKYLVSEVVGRLEVRNRYEAAAWPERCPWWMRAVAPAALFLRRSRTPLPVSLHSAANVAAAGLIFGTFAGLALIAVLFAQARGGGERDLSPAASSGSVSSLQSSPAPPGPVSAATAPAPAELEPLGDTPGPDSQGVPATVAEGPAPGPAAPGGTATQQTGGSAPTQTDPTREATPRAPDTTPISPGSDPTPGDPGPIGGVGRNTIAVPDTAALVGEYSSLVLDASGNPVVSYWDYTNGDLKILHCGNPICSSGNAISSPDTEGRVGQWTSLALDTTGNPVVSYYDAANSDLKVLHCGDPLCSAGNTITSPDTAFDTGLFSSLVLDASGNPVVSYSSHNELKVLHCGDPTCSANNTINAPDAADNNGFWYTSLVLDTSGKPVVSYYDVTNGDIKVLHCGNPACSADNSMASADTAGDVGLWTSLALDGFGNPVVSYFDFTNHDLKLLRCSNPNCTEDNFIGSPDAAGYVGPFSSLALDASGNPIVSYMDMDNGVLNVLHCGNPTCTSPENTVTTVDSEGIVGDSASLALDAAGNPVASYFDVDKGHLKVLHCGMPTCIEAGDEAAGLIRTFGSLHEFFGTTNSNATSNRRGLVVVRTRSVRRSS